jgi:hypothetical protein
MLLSIQAGYDARLPLSMEGDGTRFQIECTANEVAIVIEAGPKVESFLNAKVR